MLLAKISCYMSYKFTRVGGTTHLVARQINYSNRMLSGSQMSHVNLQGFGNVEISEGTIYIWIIAITV